jgi:hypothetical protein
MLAVFQEAGPPVFAEELNDRRGVSRVVLLHRHGHHAETLRLVSIPETLLATADEVIE